MNKLMVVVLLAVFFEIVSSVNTVNSQNDPSKSPINANSAPRRQTASLQRQPTIAKQRSKPGYDIGLIQLHPRNSFIDNLSSPIQKFIEYMMGGIYALSNMFSRDQQHTKVTSTAVKKPVKSVVDKQPNRAKIPTKNNPRTTPTNQDGQLGTKGHPSTSRPPMKVNVAPGIPVQEPKTTVTVEGKNDKIYVNDEPKYSDDKIFINRREVHVRIRDGNFLVNGNLVMKKGRSDYDRVYQSTYNLDFVRTTHFIMKIYSNGILHYGDNSGARAQVYYYIPIEFLNSI